MGFFSDFTKIVPDAPDVAVEDVLDRRNTSLVNRIFRRIRRKIT